MTVADQYFRAICVTALEAVVFMLAIEFNGMFIEEFLLTIVAIKNFHKSALISELEKLRMGWRKHCVRVTASL